MVWGEEEMRILKVLSHVIQQLRVYFFDVRLTYLAGYERTLRINVTFWLQLWQIGESYSYLKQVGKKKKAF